MVDAIFSKTGTSWSSNASTYARCTTMRPPCGFVCDVPLIGDTTHCDVFSTIASVYASSSRGQAFFSSFKIIKQIWVVRVASDGKAAHHASPSDLFAALFETSNH
ncbi:MAG TPA: hypothetical protein VEG44_01830 [Candidatus Acidoferrales bacterium]|nr:hypothetical protein [Candidatus Acidoferrales bacterium]